MNNYRVFNFIIINACPDQTMYYMPYETYPILEILSVPDSNNCFGKAVFPFVHTCVVYA